MIFPQCLSESLELLFYNKRKLITGHHLLTGGKAYYSI